jgi:hypothetical protein
MARKSPKQSTKLNGSSRTRLSLHQDIVASVLNRRSGQMSTGNIVRQNKFATQSDPAIARGIHDGMPGVGLISVSKALVITCGAYQVGSLTPQVLQEQL